MSVSHLHDVDDWQRILAVVGECVCWETMPAGKTREEVALDFLAAPWPVNGPAHAVIQALGVDKRCELVWREVLDCFSIGLGTSPMRPHESTDGKACASLSLAGTWGIGYDSLHGLDHPDTQAEIEARLYIHITGHPDFESARHHLERLLGRYLPVQAQAAMELPDAPRSL